MVLINNKKICLYTNWSTLLRMIQLDLWEKSPDNKERLLKAIKDHRNYKNGWLKDKFILEKVRDNP